MKNLTLLQLSVLLFFSILVSSCNSSSSKMNSSNYEDSIAKTTIVSGDILSYATPNLDGPSVLLFNFHSTNRCVSCNAIEANTKKTIETYFAKEMQEGRVKMMVFNVDDDVNAAIAETFQATGTSLFLVEVLNGNSSIIDVTEDGFKYAKHHPEQLIELLKVKIEENLR